MIHGKLVSKMKECKVKKRAMGDSCLIFMCWWSPKNAIFTWQAMVLGQQANLVNKGNVKANQLFYFRKPSVHFAIILITHLMLQAIYL